MISVPTLQFILSIDQSYLAFMESVRTPWLTDIVLVLTHLGDPVVLLLISALLLLWLWMKKRSIEVLVFGGSMFFGSAFVWVVKKIIARERPIGIIEETGYSFPSGHALIASIFFPLIIYVFKQYVPQKYRKVYIGLCIFLMLTSVFSRPYIGVHYLSDVLVGWIVGLCISAIAILISEGYKQKSI